MFKPPTQALKSLSTDDRNEVMPCVQAILNALELTAELRESWKQTRREIQTYKSARGKREHPESMSLVEVREWLGMPRQCQAAKYAHIRQSRVAALEHDTDMKVSSLAGYIEGLGGTLSVIAEPRNGECGPVKIETLSASFKRVKRPPAAKLPSLAEPGATSREVDKTFRRLAPADAEGISAWIQKIADIKKQEDYWFKKLKESRTELDDLKAGKNSSDGKIAAFKSKTLEDLRLYLGMTQKEVAGRAGVTQTAVSHRECRYEDMLLSTLKQHMEGLDCGLNLSAQFPGRPPVSISGPRPSVEFSRKSLRPVTEEQSSPAIVAQIPVLVAS